MFGLNNSTLAIIIREMQKFPQIQEAIIFGSRAKGTSTPGSDIDIAVKGPHISSRTVDKLRRILNEEAPIPHHVDIVHYEKITNHSLREHIDRVGKALPLQAAEASQTK